MIKYVDLLQTQGDGTSVPFFRFKLDTEDTNQTIVSEPMNGYTGKLEHILEDSEFIVGKDGKLFSIKDHGILFLKNLKFQYSGSIIRATDVQNLNQNLK